MAQLEFGLPETSLRHARGTELIIPGKSFTAGDASSMAYDLPEREKLPKALGPLSLTLALIYGAACSGNTPKETPNTPNTPTAAAKPFTPSPTATVVEVPPTPKPESEFIFGDYDVFVGVDVVFTALPNGKLLFQAAKPEVTCSNPKFPLYKYLVALPYTPGGFNFSDKNRSITGRLVSPTTFNGSMSNREYTAVTPDGPMTCPANSFPITAQRVGKGQEAFLKAYRTAMGYPATTSLTEIRANINRAIALYGFELP